MYCDITLYIFLNNKDLKFIINIYSICRLSNMLGKIFSWSLESICMPSYIIIEHANMISYLEYVKGMGFHLLIILCYECLCMSMSFKYIPTRNLLSTRGSIELKNQMLKEFSGIFLCLLICFQFKLE